MDLISATIDRPMALSITSGKIIAGSCGTNNVRLYYIGLDTVEESKQRIANRVAKGGHNIPDEDVNRRFKNRWAALKEILPFCDDALFFDNNNGFVRVASYRTGDLVLEGDYRPKWIVELSRTLSS